MCVFCLLHTLVNTWCSLIFLLPFAILTERWSDVFWISLVTSDIKTSFHVIIGHPCVLLCINMCVWTIVEARSQYCMSSLIILHLYFWDLGFIDLAGQLDWTVRSSNLQVSASLALRLQVHGTVPSVFTECWRFELRSPCLRSKHLPINCLPRPPYLVFSDKVSIQVFYPL